MITMPFLAGWALRSSLLIATGTALLKIGRVKDPAIRLAACTAMLCGSLAIPLFAAALPRVPLTIPLQAVRMAKAPAPVTIEAAPARAIDRPASVPPTAFDWTRLALGLYTVVAGVLLLRVCAGVTIGWRVLGASRATEKTGIRESDRVGSPVALGIARPAIVLPEDWREWHHGKLHAVLAHERSHIRRHDPAVQLLSAIHRALLWYSPLSWYLDRRIVREAEEASDDAAVAAGLDRASYAEVLLEFMQRGVRRAEWQGVAMARYGRPEKRIDRILDATSLSRGVTRRSFAAILALGAPLAYLASAARPQNASLSVDPSARFEAASVKPFNFAPAGGGGGVAVKQKQAGPPGGRGGDPSGGPGSSDPGRIHYPGVTLQFVLLTAFNTNNFQLSGPDWLTRTRYDIDATMPADTTAERFHSMLRNLLADRFKMTFHREIRELSGYLLVLARDGPKFKESTAELPQTDDAMPDPPRRPGPDGYFPAPKRPGVFFQLAGLDAARATFQQATMQTLVTTLQSQLKCPVSDATGLTGKYDFILDYSPEGLDLGGGRIPVSMGDQQPKSDIASALQAQLGLKLESKKMPVDVIVIDRIEKAPIEN